MNAHATPTRPRILRLPVRQLLTALAAAMALCACTLDDPRDLCCPDALAMTYTYRPYGAEAFSENIGSLRHFLFDADGGYLTELPPGQDLQYQPLDLPEGTYTMVTVGNHGEATDLNHHQSPHLAALALTCTADRADELFWGVSRFAVADNGTATDLTPARDAVRYTRLTTPMNNIHCHLTVRVEWANVPQYIGTYEMELSGVPSRYVLHPDSAAALPAGFTVPVHDSLGTHRIYVTMVGQELLGEFVTLRYTDTDIPTLRLRYGDTQVGPDIDLGRAFEAWGWHPSRVHVQEYSVTVRLYGDGHAELSPRIEASVSDWIDGGTFG